MAIGDIIEVLFRGIGPGGVWETTLGFSVLANGVNGTDLLNDLTSNVDAFTQNVAQNLQQVLNPAFTMLDCVAVDIKPGTAANIVHGFGAGLVGLDTGQGDALPPQISAVTQLKTALKGASFRGRFSLPGGSEGRQGAGTWSSAYTTLLDRYPAHLLVRYGPAGTNTNFRWSVISRFHLGAKRVPPIATAITSYSINGICGTQRTRA